MKEPWRAPFFRMLAGQALSLVSSNVVQFAVIWWVAVKTGSAVALSAATLAGLLPQVALGPFAGPWIDRASRKTALIAADAGIALSGLLLALAFLVREPPLWFVCAVLALRSVGDAFHKPALKAAVPQLVPAEALTKAAGFGQFVQSAAGIAGPILGGYLMEALPLWAVMLVDLLGATLAILALGGLPLGPAPSRTTSRARPFAEIGEGFRAMRAVPGLLRASFAVFVTSLVFLPLGSLLPLMVKDVFGGGAGENGLVRALFSAGTLAAALLVGLTGGGKRPFLSIAASSAALGVVSFAAGSLGAGAFGAFCAAAFAMGASGMWGSIPYTALIQREVPAERLGTALSLVTSAMGLGVPLGLLVAGPAAEALGISAWMRGAGAVLVATGIAGYLLTRRFEVMPRRGEGQAAAR